MKRKAKASLTVETAMLFPIVFLLLLAVMQCALFLVYETYVKALCDQGVILCQSWYAPVSYTHLDVYKRQGRTHIMDNKLG